MGSMLMLGLHDIMPQCSVQMVWWACSCIFRRFWTIGELAWVSCRHRMSPSASRRRKRLKDWEVDILDGLERLLQLRLHIFRLVTLFNGIGFIGIFISLLCTAERYGAGRADTLVNGGWFTITSGGVKSRVHRQRFSWMIRHRGIRGFVGQIR